MCSCMQVRGAYEPPPMVAALCSAFPDGSEPSNCLAFSPANCAENSDSWTTCRSGYYAGTGRTRCQQTFGGYECTCAAPCLYTFSHSLICFCLFNARAQRSISTSRPSVIGSLSRLRLRRTARRDGVSFFAGICPPLAFFAHIRPPAFSAALALQLCAVRAVRV
jgi:hypothetical protein